MAWLNLMGVGTTGAGSFFILQTVHITYFQTVAIFGVWGIQLHTVKSRSQNYSGFRGLVQEICFPQKMTF